MKASIIMPSYNSLFYLKNTIDSLEKQDIGFDNFELIVVDDGSSDGTSELLKNYSGEINLNYVINEKNLGRARTRNIGIGKAKYELIIFLDSDIEVRQNFVRLHTERQKDGDIAFVGRIVFHPDLKLNSYMKYLDSKGVAKILPGDKVPGKYFITGNSSIPKKILIEIGKFDECFNHYGGEDTDIGIRLEKRIPIINLPEAIGYNQRFRDLNDTLKLIVEYGQFSLPYLLKKHPEFTKDLKIRRGATELFYKFICLPFFYSFLKFFADKNLAPSLVFSYLLIRNYRKGFFAQDRKDTQ
jgi:glycosyltransferase involved in cell wall biosynthesis